MDILLAVDGSEYSRKSAHWVVAHAASMRKKPRITVLTVHPAIPVGPAPAVVGKHAIERYYREECEAALAGATAILARRGVTHEARWLVGDPASAIVQFARKHKAKLVVMGSRGEGALAGLLLGSVVTKVLARSKTPVVVVR